MSHAFWTRRFAGKPPALGMDLARSQSYQVVGVAQAVFTGAQPGILTDVWLPNGCSSATRSRPRLNWLQVWGRLGPNATRGIVQPIVATTLTNFEAEQGAPNLTASSRRQNPAIEFVDAATG